MATMTASRQSIEAIDPNRFYTESDLRTAFGIEPARLHAGHAAGKLKTTRWGGVVRYDGAFLVRCFGAPQFPTEDLSPDLSPEARERRLAREGQRARRRDRPAASDEHRPAASDENSAISFRQAVAANVKRGMSTRNATKKTVKEFPKLHLAYLRNANADRPNATRHLQG